MFIHILTLKTAGRSLSKSPSDIFKSSVSSQVPLRKVIRDFWLLKRTLLNL